MNTQSQETMPENLLIIHKTQFGYHTGNYKHSIYLKDDYNVSFICFDTGCQKVEVDKVDVIYVSSKGYKLIRGTRFILTIIKHLLTFKGIVFVTFFEHCQILKQLMPWKKMILDIRTLSINRNKKRRISEDRKLKKTTQHFDFTAIISDKLRKRLDLDSKKTVILPLGADIISIENKNFQGSINLLYVGALDGRNICQTITGLSYFCLKNSVNQVITYDIIGDGAELPHLRQLVSDHGLERIVTIHGRIPHIELSPFFNKCNVGVSFVPMTEFYEYQPVTKTYEYVLSGMPCIATNTYENRQVISSENGVLCDDSPEGFASGLERIIANFDRFNSDNIRSTLIEHTWVNIVNTKLIPILKRLN